MLDLESLMKSVLKLYSSTLNGEITKANLLKKDFEIEIIDQKAWAVQNFSQRLINFNPFAVIAIVESPKVLDNAGGDTLYNVEIDIEVVLSNINPKEGQETFYVMSRYIKALELVMIKNYANIFLSNKFVISSLLPVEIKLGNRNYDSAGIRINATVG